MELLTRHYEDILLVFRYWLALISKYRKLNIDPMKNYIYNL